MHKSCIITKNSVCAIIFIQTFKEKNMETYNQIQGQQPVEQAPANSSITEATPAHVASGNVYMPRLQGWEIIPQQDMTQKIAVRAAILNAIPVRITESFWGN